MPKFFFSRKVIKHSKMYGSSDILCRIFQLKGNNLILLGGVEYNTSSTRGAISEVFNKLIEMKKIPKKCYKFSKSDWQGAGYYCSEVEKAGYYIYEID